LGFLQGGHLVGAYFNFNQCKFLTFFDGLPAEFLKSFQRNKETLDSTILISFLEVFAWIYSFKKWRRCIRWSGSHIFTLIVPLLSAYRLAKFQLEIPAKVISS